MDSWPLSHKGSPVTDLRRLGMLVLPWRLYSECCSEWTFSLSLDICRLAVPGSSTGTPACLLLVVGCSLASAVWSQSCRESATCVHLPKKHNVFLFVAYSDDKEWPPAAQLLWSNGVWPLSPCRRHRVSHLQKDYSFVLVPSGSRAHRVWLYI